VSVALAPVRVETGGPDEEGRLVFLGERLVAVLVRLSEEHGEEAGRWYVEHGFGPLDGPLHPTFPNLDAACAWIVAGLGRRADARPGGR